eukprot:scaffold21.g2130.t1
MAISDVRVIGALAGAFALGMLLQFLGCALWHNWWPMLTAFMYVLVPMPILFFGGGGGSSMASGWRDAGQFLTGFSAIGTIAIPAILYHAGKITAGALWMEVLAALVIFGTAGAFVFLSEEGGGAPFYY